MKSTSASYLRPNAAPNIHARRAPKRGAALLVVLACLVFLSALVLAFLSSVSTELQSSQSFANASQVKMLADSAVNIAMGQIQDATRSVDTSGNSITWASQPGMIRTFAIGGAQSSFYKLYSSDKMYGTGVFNPTSDEPPTDWNDNPAIFTDLNEPIYKKGSTAPLYPIVDPSALGTVKGFSVDAAPAVPRNALPMPVKWLYVLQDGAVECPTGSGSLATVPSASATNPIVARIAFWTDDDTSKVNINTAAGDVWVDSAAPPAPGAAGNPGAFWDIPRNNAAVEKNYYSKFQPAQREFQRYPGHPATTYLSAVFPGLSAAQIMLLTPRVSTGGSLGGTQVASTAVAADMERLYASVDELLFAADRQKNPTLTSAMVRQSTFFLTAHSRAPELNLFSRPRVSLWPVHVNNTITTRTAVDNLVAHCGTLNAAGGNTYFFQRGNKASNTLDLPATASATGLGRNRSLINYLRNLTSKPIPGFSPGNATFLQKYPKDRDQILTEIFDYIRCTNGQDTSVIGLSPFTTSGNNAAGQGQIIPIIDNSHADSNTTQLRGFGRFPTIRSATLVFAGVGQTKGVQKSVPPLASQTPATAIADGKTRVQAMLLLTLFDPSQGFAPTVPNFRVRITNANALQWNTSGTSMGFPATGTVSMTKNYNTGVYGGYRGTSMFAINGGVMTGAYPWISSWLDLPTDGTFSFLGTTSPIKVEIMDITANTVYQTLNLEFPAATLKVPSLAPFLDDPGIPAQSNPALQSDMRDWTKRFVGCSANSYTILSRTWMSAKDVVRSVEANTDYRTIAALTDVPSSYFSPIMPQYADSEIRQVHGLYECSNGTGAYLLIGTMLGQLVKNGDYGMTGSYAPVTTGDFGYAGTQPDGLQPIAKTGGVSTAGTIMPVGFGKTSAGSTGCVPINGPTAGSNYNAGTVPGDWDNGFSIVPDGAFINKADEGIETTTTTLYPYFTWLTGGGVGSTFFSPNRQMPCAIMFGSLPTGVFSDRPWQTLLFRPDPGGSPQHIGAVSPPDYLLLDLFTMPIVEPYPISDPFSTAGKINMNCQIVPFTYIKRETGLQAVLRSEQPLAMQDSDCKTYKVQSTAYANRRSYLDIDQTLTGIRRRFADNDLFRSESEICSLWLVPQGQTYDAMQTFWQTRTLTGDNVRERPYANLYPRLTTRSNTYTVHFRVQTLKKAKNGAPVTEWNETNNLVTSDFRGSSVIERYLDTANTAIPDYATAVNPAPLDNFYKVRVIETKQFNP
ncbi:MAG TPA: Verru_Chthon cassette protein A [Candidatus Methylacidiphilales bacterium]|nr:Verru_Chthon cassette protein A [Candidatus Methylacidiphilales bacterium]